MSYTDIPLSVYTSINFKNVSVTSVIVEGKKAISFTTKKKGISKINPNP